MDRRAELFAKWREIWLLSSTISVLEWDEETSMPSAGAAHRSEQLAYLAGLMHDKLLDPRLLDVVRALGNDPHANAARDVIERHSKLPRALVLEEKHAVIMAQRAWLEAREQHSFAKLAPSFARVVELKRETSKCLGGDDAWECHLREHEPNASSADVTALLLRLGAALRERIMRASRPAGSARFGPLHRDIDDDTRGYAVALCVETLGYDAARGGFGENVHPFCSTLGPDDVRIALRPPSSKSDLQDTLGYVMHEIGHALYEQGVPRDLLGTPGGELRSTSLHESQSRLFEIELGRSRALWSHLLPPLTRKIGALRNTSVDDVVSSLHRIEPGPIRVGADPVTYNLHILVRVELERALLDGRLAVGDLAEAWNASYDAHLGVRPANDVEGVLQDGHWSAGMFGYFPTYAIGNVAAAQLMSAIHRSIPQLDEDIARGDTRSLRHWLAHHVWSRAGTATLDEIIVDATGEKLNEAAFLARLS